MVTKSVKKAPRTNWAVVRSKWGVYHLTTWRVEGNEHFRSLVCSPTVKAEKPEYQPTIEGQEYSCAMCEKVSKDGTRPAV
jgi:hypothetical protein